MILKELIDVVDPEMEGCAWFNFLDHSSNLVCKANTRSTFLTPIYDREVEIVEAEDKQLFNVYLIGDI